MRRRGSDTRAARAALLRFAVQMSLRNSAAARGALRRARALGARRVAAEEVALMLVLYAGYPAALEGTRVVREAWPGNAKSTPGGTRSVWRARGERLCRRVYGPLYDRLIGRVRDRHPDLAAWMIEDGYGRVLSRPGLAAGERERVTIAVLAALGWERQLLSHLHGAARVGVKAAGIVEAWGIGRASSVDRRIADRAWREAFPQLSPRASAAGPRRR